MSMLLVSILGTGFSIEKIQTEMEDQQVSTGDISNEMVIPGGMPIGIYLETDGVLVLDTDSIVSIDGQKINPAENLIKSGDYILEINGTAVSSKKDLIKNIGELESDEVVLRVRREGEEIDVKVHAVQTKNNGYKLGIWVRDNVQGLGTLTYLTLDNEFGALGHGIHDTDTDGLLEIGEGSVYEAKVLRIEKGEKGSPGGMEGMIVYNRYNLLGTIEKNTDVGVYGEIDKVDSLINDKTAIPVATKSEVETGEATIRCCVEGEVKEYDIEIQKIDRFSTEENKGMVIKVTDSELLEITGGIIQGMSGSPIIQNGYLVGAVTHVFVNDPTKGYGIFIENMLEAAG